MKWIVVLIILLSGPAFVGTCYGSSVGWQALRLGNGGVITRLDIAPDGTMVSGTDTFGCYIWSNAQNEWRQLLTTSVMPAGAVPEGSLGVGCYEIRIDPSNSSNVWMMWNGNLYKSTNKAISFTPTGFPTQPNYPDAANNSPTKAWGPFGSVDPSNSNVAYWSTPQRGLYFTSDGGTSFSQVTALAAGLPGNINNIAASPSAGTDSTSLAVGVGSKVFDNNSATFGFAVAKTNFVQIWQTSNPANQMIGNVTASSGRSFTVNVTSAQGSGTHSDWTVGMPNAVGGGHRIVFDTSAGTTTVSGQIRTRNIFAHTYNVGTWKSIDGGVTWASLSSKGKPRGIRRMAVDPFGTLWVVDDDYPSSNSNIDKYDGITWSGHLATGIGNVWYDQVAVDPTQCSAKNTCHIAFVQGSQILVALTTDGGSSWNNSGGTGNRSYVSNGDVDWLLTYYKVQPNVFFGAAAASFDPAHSGRLYIGAEGVWFLTPTRGAAITLTQQTRGIEQFIASKIISPNSSVSSVLMATWDFPCFYSSNFNAYPSAISCAAGAGQTNLLRGYSLDWVWNSPSTIVSIVQDGTGAGVVGTGLEWSGISKQGGIPGSWYKFPAPASKAVGGCIAASDANHIVWVSTNSANKPKITTNGGTSWSDISIPEGTPTSGWGPIAPYATGSKMCESDKGNGDIYLYNVNDGVSGDKFFKWTKATGLWSTQSHPNFAAANINEQLKSVPGNAGHLFFTPGLGADPHPNNVPFYYTTNGWATMATVLGFREVTSFGFGASFSGQSYPSVYAAGWFTGRAVVNGRLSSVTDAYGIYMCKDFNTRTGTCTTTWTQLGERYPTGIIATVIDMDGDKLTPGIVYIITNGGAFRGEFN